jgi:Flp pilus assembly protein TadD
LGVIYARRQQWAEALVEFRAALTQRPKVWQYRSNIGACLAALGQFDEAITEYQEALHAAPDSAQVWRLLGVALDAQRHSEEAVKAYREAVRLNADGPLELNELAWFLATDPHSELRDGPEAVRLAKRACELTYGNEPRCLGTLDAAYAEAGLFDEAAATAMKAREAALAKGQTAVATAADERLQLYQAGKPFRQHK